MTDDPRQLTGSCLCGGVRYTARGPFRDVIFCHCRQCAKTTGHHAAATQVASADLVLESDETLAWFASSETAERGFCSRCGGNLFWRRHGSDRVSIMAGTLDMPSGLRATSQIHADAASDYYDPPSDVPAVAQSSKPF